uniref:Uncharacterized protein n=1 Tax=Cricetulus griseus TaxID=10029 RepID=A0A8C2MXM7_CRIGR
VKPEAATGMDEFLMIWHHKTTILTDAKESSTVFELKHILEGILKRPPMCSGCTRMTSSLMMEKLGECGFTTTVGLAFRADAFEALRIEP